MKDPMVWIIDDDMVAQFAATYKIGQSNANYRVICYDSVEDALTAIGKCIDGNVGIPDIVLLDLSFPESDGWDFLDKIEENQKSAAEMEIYIVSSFSNPKDKIYAQEHPMVKAYFDKPITKTNLDHVFSPSEYDWPKKNHRK